MFRPPYRWAACPWQNLRSCWYDFWYGLRNIIRWTPVIWFDADFDWEYLAIIMSFKLKLMERSTEHWMVMGAERARKQMQICRNLLDRLREDKYDGIRGDGWTQQSVKLYQHQQKADREMLGKVFSRHLMHWWD